MNRFTKQLMAGAFSLVAVGAFASVPSNFTVTPAPGSTVEEISVITIDVDNGYNDVYAETSSGTFTINGQAYGKDDFTFSWPNFENMLRIQLNTPITAPGEYTISFPYGYFYDDWDAPVGGAAEWTVTIEGQEDTPPASSIPSYFSVTPADGSTVDELKTISVKYSGYNEFIASFMSKTFTIDGTEYSYKNGDFTFQYLGLYEDTFQITLANGITTPGSHYISFPKGYFYEDGGVLKDLDAVAWSVIIEGNGGGDTPTNPEKPETVIPYTYTVTPEPDSTVEQITTITIYSRSDDEFVIYPSATFKIDGNTLKRNTDFTAAVSGDYDDLITITLNTPVSSAGLHVIEIPAGFFYYGMWEDDNDPFVWSVTVEGNGGGDGPEPGTPSIPANFTVTPADGNSVEGLTTISITSDEYTYFSPNARVKIAVDGSDVETTSSVSGTLSNVLTYTLTTPVEEIGEYTVTIPAGAFTYYDTADVMQTSEVFSFKVNVIAPQGEFIPFENPGVIVEPEQGEYPSLTEFHLTFMGSHYFPETNGFFPIYLKNEDTGENVAQLRGLEGGAYTDIYLVLPEPVTAKGHYILDIPEGAIYDYDDYDMPAMKFRYWVDGSGTVEVPQETLYAYPSDGSTVAKLDKIILDFPNMTEVFASGPQKNDIKVTCNGEEVDTNISFSFDNTNYTSEINVLFNPALTAEGNYEIYFPAYVFSLGATQFDTRWNYEFTLHYTVAPEMRIESITPANGSELEVLDKITVKLVSGSILQNEEEITTVIGTLVDSVPQGAEGPEAFWSGSAKSALEYVLTPCDALGQPMEIQIPVGETLFVMLPAGLFTLPSDTSAESPAVMLAYSCTETTGIDSINLNNEEIEIYTIDGIRVNEMQPGKLYIIRSAGKTLKRVGK